MKMRYLSRIFQPIVSIPKNAKIKNTEITCKSQKLLLECGLVRPTSHGFFTLLPLARRALDKLENIIKKSFDDAGCQRMSFPILSSAGLWEKTGRLDEVGSELLQLQDRHGKKYLLAPTHEESIADLLADIGPLSYKQLPLMLYQIGNKYRDEQRPKHGLLRAREFVMLDAYSAHARGADARAEYDRMRGAYEGVWGAVGLQVYRVEAPTGTMGGSISHEWQLPSLSGEDKLQICPSCSHARLATEDNKCECGKEMERTGSIEVGHTFILGTRYSEPLGANYVTSDGRSEPIIMACYGLGVTRLLAASLEALSSDKALRWPRSIAPYEAIVIGPKEGSKEWQKHGIEHIEGVARRVQGAGLDDDVIIDDRHSMTIGKRLMMADRLGIPYIIVCGKASLEDPPKYELYDADRKVQILTLPELIQALKERDGDSEDNIVKNKA